MQSRSALQKEPALILSAIIVVYIVLGVLYESYVHPITILSTLPSAGVGALLALLLLGYDLSLISLIGIVLLIGIVKKNAIMMIDFALQAERSDAGDPKEAILRACSLRFRPIMMTTLVGRPLIGMLERPEGASVAELGQRLGWLPHTVRAAMTGLRHAGREVTRSKDADGQSVYRLARPETVGR
jgi:hypothetical protein